MKRGSRQIHKVIFVLLMIATVWMSIGLVSAIEESVDGGWNLASGSNAEETETDMTVPDETASPSDAVEEGGEIDSEATPSDATPSEATPSEAEPGTEGSGEGDTSGELEWDPIPEFEQDEHVVFEMKPLYLDANASTWDFLKDVSAHDQDGNALEVTLAEGEGNFYKASADYAEAKGLSDSADGELATLRKGRYYEVVQAWDAVDNRMNKAARIIYVGSPEDFTPDKLPEVATGSDAAMKDGELATGSNALKNVTFEMEPLYLSPTADVSTIDLTSGAKAVDEEGNELPVFLVDKGTFAEAYVGPGSRQSLLRSAAVEETAETEGQQEGQTLVEGSYYVTVGAENSQDGSVGTAQRSVVVGNAATVLAEEGTASVSVVEPDGTMSAALATFEEAFKFINTKTNVGTYKLLVSGDVHGLAARPTEILGSHVEKLVIEGTTADAKVYASMAYKVTVWHKNCEFRNIWVVGLMDIDYSENVIIGEGTTVNMLRSRSDRKETAIIEKNATILNLENAGSDILEIQAREFEGTISTIKGTSTATAKGVDIFAYSSNITVETMTGLGKFHFQGNSTLRLLGSGDSQMDIGSLVIDGSNNRLELAREVTILPDETEESKISGTGKLRLAPVSGTSWALGQVLIECGNKASAQAKYFEDEFDGGDLYVEVNPDTGYIRTSAPLKYIHVINGNVKSYHSSLKKALQKIGTGTGTYKIVFAKPNYTISSDDVKAYDEYGVNASEITYTGTYTLTSEDILQTGEAVGQTVTRDISIDGDIEFSSNTRIEGIGITFNKENCGIYAGGNDLTIGADVSFKGSNIPVLYGGSGSKNVSRTSVTVENGSYQSIYGGGNATEVTGGTSVTVADTVSVKALSGGSAGSGSVSGKRQINLTGTNSFDSIVDFDELNLGTASAGAEITVDGALDSDSSLAAEAVRGGMVHFQGGSTLTLNGNGAAVLAVGTLKNDNNKNNRLLLSKPGQGINCLTITGCINEAQDTPLKMGLISGSYAAKLLDKFLILTDRSAVSTKSFELENLDFNLFVSKESGGGGSLCLGLLREPGGELLKVVHQLTDGTATAPEDGTIKPGKKVFLQLYDVDMNSPFSTGAGLDTDTIYIDNSSSLSQSWMTDDIVPATSFPVEIEDPNGDGKHTWKGSAVIDEVDASRIYYVHLKDKMDNYAILPIDTLAPGKSEDVKTAAVSGGFSVNLKLMDQTKTSQSGIAYAAGGIAQVGWSLTEMDTESLMEDYTLSTLNDVKKVNPAAASYDYQFQVTGADMNGNSSKIIYVYVKDSYGNTSKTAIPISQYIMNVSVPGKVGVVAVKGGAAPKLLTPDCYITNKGFFPIKISVETFTNRSATASNAIKVVDKPSGFGEDEINLKLLPLDGTAAFGETPLAGIGESAPLELGIIPGIGSADNKLGFKFGADFDQNILKEFAGFEPFVMSYKMELAVQ